MTASWSPARRRAYEDSRVNKQQRFRPDEEVRFCPECAVPRPTQESMRVHRWLAHEVKEMPAGQAPFPTRD